MTTATTISDYYHYIPYKRKDRQKKWCGYFQFSVDFLIRLGMFDLLVGRRQNDKLYWGHISAYTEKERDDLAKKYKAIIEERIAKMINDYDENIYKRAKIKKLNGDVICNHAYSCEAPYSSEEDQDYTSEIVKFINVRKKRKRRQQNKNDNNNRNYQDNVNDKEEKEENAEGGNNEEQNEDPVNEMDDGDMDDGGMDVNNKEEDDDPEQQYIGSQLHIENTEYWQQNSRGGKGSGRRRCGNGSNEDVQMD